MKLIFLDIDGVLNHYVSPYDADAPTIHNDLIRKLNEIIRATGAKIVLSSAWRQYIHNGYMTEPGFHFLLRSHGLTALTEIIGVTRPSKFSEGANPDFRHNQIKDWMWDNRGLVKSFVILDDMSIKGYPDNFVQTDESVGLTDENVTRAIRILGRIDG